MKSILALFSLLVTASLLIAQYSEIPENQGYPECGLELLTVDPLDLVRPARPTLSGPVSRRYKTHVVVHYTTSGGDATTAAFAESVAVYAESCWVRAEALLWAVPPPDQGVGYDDRFDIYLRSTANIGAYGVACWDSNYTNPYPDGYSSWLEITKDSVPQPFTVYDRLRALVAHEFHHGCQYRYSRSEQPYWWFYENTTVWMEDILMPGYGTLYWRNSPTTTYTQNPLTRSWYSINDTTSTYEYPGSLWAKFLAEYYASYAVRYIWWCCGYHTGSHCLYDTDSMLRTYFDSNLQDALGHYAMWRYFTGGRDDNRHFFGAEQCTTAILHASHTTYPANGNEGTHDPVGPGGMDLIEFQTNGSQNLTITFNGQNGYNWRAYVVCVRGGTSYEQRILLNSSGDGSITIPAWMITRAILVPVVVHWSDASYYTPALTFTYSASSSDGKVEITENDISQPLLVGSVPNPMTISTKITYALPKGQKGEIRIFDIVGRTVRTFELTGTGTAETIVWNRNDQHYNPVSSGVYFCQLTCQGKLFQQKIVVK